MLSQSLRESGRFVRNLSSHNQTKHVGGCRNPFVNQVVSFRTKKDAIGAAVIMSQSLRESGRFVHRCKMVAEFYGWSQSLRESGRFVQAALPRTRELGKSQSLRESGRFVRYM